MKSKLLYVLLVAGVLVLIGYAVSLTRTLFDLHVAPQAPVASQPVAQPVPVAERFIDLGTPAPESAPPGPVGRQVETPASSTPTARATEKPTRIQAAQARASAVPPATNAGDTATTNHIGVVAALRGQAFARSPDTQQRSLVLDAQIFRTEQLTTGRGSRLQVKFLDGSLLSLGENSEVLLEEYAYTPQEKSQACYVMRMVKGASRVVTGLIVDLNPQRFQVKTGLATIGIRGCDLGFRSSDQKNEILLFDLAGARSVQVDTTTDGTAMLDPITGMEVAVAPSKVKTMTLTEPRRMVTVQKGVGVEERPLSLDDMLKFSDETWHYSQAQHNLQQGPQGATIRVQPLPGAPAANSGAPKP